MILGVTRLVLDHHSRGIDAEAHGAALSTGTAGIVAGGIDVVYPRENADLMTKMRSKGLILSEQPMGLTPQARHFPRRNRLISGCAEALLVLEAAAKSGSLITARTAADQGREVLAVPGHPFDARASGANQLIRDGATLVRGADDILAALDSPCSMRRVVERDAPPSAPPRPIPNDALRMQILDCLGPSPVAEDQLIRDLAQPAAAVTALLTELEMAGTITRAAGGLLSRAA